MSPLHARTRLPARTPIRRGGWSYLLVGQSDAVWNLKLSLRSPTDWAEPVAIMARLAAQVDTTGTIISRPPGTRRKQVDWALLPSAVFGQFIEVRDAINRCFVHEQCQPQPEPDVDAKPVPTTDPATAFTVTATRKVDMRRRVLGGDDLLPIFIYVIARRSVTWTHACSMRVRNCR